MMEDDSNIGIVLMDHVYSGVPIPSNGHTFADTKVLNATWGGALLQSSRIILFNDMEIHFGLLNVQDHSPQNELDALNVVSILDLYRTHMDRLNEI